MVAMIESEDVIQESIGPGMYQFPKLPSERGHNLGKWSWFRMIELDKEVFELLSKQGYQGQPYGYAPQYRTFGSHFFPRRFLNPFVWVSHDPVRLPHSLTTLHINPDMGECPFEDDRTFVPMIWSRQLLKFISQGIVRIDKNGSLIGTRWNGSNVPEADLHALLEE